MGDGPILKLTSKLNLNLVCTKESSSHEGCWYHRCTDHDPQFNAVQLQVAIGLGWWVLVNRLFIIQSSFDQDDEEQTKGTTCLTGACDTREVER